MPARPRAFTNGQRETMELQSWRERGDEEKMMKRPQSHKIRRRSGDEEPTWPPRIRSNNIHSPKSNGIWQPRKATHSLLVRDNEHDGYDLQERCGCTA